MNSATVAAAQTATAAQYNNLRKDLVLAAGDYATSGGSANAHTLALDAQIVTSYTAGMLIKFKAGFTNTASATINVNSIGANTLRRQDGALLAPSDIVANKLYEIMYDGTNFILLTPSRESLLPGTSGEALAVGEAAYSKDSDSKLYRTDADGDESTYKFVGFIQSAAAGADEPVVFAPPGTHAYGLSSLTKGAHYYLSGTAGAIATTGHATRYARVAQATGTTTIRVIEPKFIRKGSQTFTTTGSTTVTIGFRVGTAHIRANGGTHQYATGSIGRWTEGIGAQCTYYYKDDNAGTTAIDAWDADTTNAWSLAFDPFAASISRCEGTIDNVTETAFDLHCTSFGSPTYFGTMTVEYEVEN